MRLVLLRVWFAIGITSGSTLVGEEGEGEMKETADSPAYHAEWGPSRGFEPGKTVPDIPLIDLDGKEVRFDRFLGKRYVLYGWASW
ncbi:MAG: hypothetical protein AAF733_00150 [Verrucomicrobiota bacterium]